MTLQIHDEHEEIMTCTYDDLKELQNKLMLMSGRGQQNQSEVEHFTEVCILIVWFVVVPKLFIVHICFQSAH